MSDRKQLQRDILSNAASRSNGFVLPLPASAGGELAQAADLIEEMISRQFVVERPVLPHEAFWVEEDSEHSRVLVITGLGVRALAADPGKNLLYRSAKGDIDADRLPVEADKSAVPDEAVVHAPQTKIMLLVAALRSDVGASIEELAELTSWQPKSVRAAISAQVRTKLGYAVETIVDVGKPRRYRLASSEVVSS